ncbi:MAG: regulatory protein GemA [Desulfuromonadaceae bacterium]|nr:regulatory protein GemA [Desulfuromonadaceae bacterium]
MISKMMDKSYRQKALAKIHIARKELGLSDIEYRDLIDSVAPGKESAADLSEEQLHLLVNRFYQLGWRPRVRRTENGPLPPMVWKARHLWLDLYALGAVHHPGWSSLARFSKRMTGVEDLRRLDVHQATIVIEALKDWLERTKGKS